MKTCPKCKWKFKQLKDRVCGYCKANQKIGINPVVIPQNKKDKPLDDLSKKELDLLVKKLLGK